VERYGFGLTQKRLHSRENTEGEGGKTRMTNLRIGDRVVLVNCSGSPGTVLEQRRGKLLVQFDDLPAVKWLLHSTSLQRAGREGD
jgi:hypothetical protein